MITMTTPEAPRAAAPGHGQIVSQVIAHGLGTIAMIDNVPLIVTHNHWPLADDRYESVSLATADDTFLLTMTTANFRALIRYADPSTLVLQLAEALHGRLSVVPYRRYLLTTGDTVTVVYRDRSDGNRATMMADTIVAIKSYQGVSSHILRSDSDAGLRPVDSGGGIFWQWQLLGNNWERLTVATTIENRLLGFR